MQTKAELLFQRMELLYENIYNLLNAFQEASESNIGDVTVTLKDNDGRTYTKTVKSFQKVMNEIIRMDNNYKSLINADNLSYTLEADGSISQQTKTSFINAEYIDKFSFDGNECIVDKNTIINQLIFPMVKLPVTINNKLLSDVNCRIYEITEGFDLIPENPTLLQLAQLRKQNKIYFNESEHTLKIEKNRVKYFGKFTTESVSVNDTTGIYTVSLNTTKYGGISTAENTINLKVNDYLVTAGGASKYQIIDIDILMRRVYIKRVSGLEIPTVGIDNLIFNEMLAIDNNVVGIPIKPNQKIVIYLSTENQKNISYPSVGIKLDTDTYMVTYDGTTYSVDEFFSEYVVNISEYLMTFINDASIPASLGIVPKSPELIKSNFKVIQINKHISNNKTVEEINQMQIQKGKVETEIDHKQTQISTIQNEIDTQKYKSKEEKQAKLNQIISHRSAVNALKQNLLTISKNIDSNATEYGLKTSKPKYRVIGYWSIQSPIYTNNTPLQHIIKYDVQYRYMTRGVDTIEATTFKMMDGDKEVTVAFSPWIDLQTKTLNKVLNVDTGKMEWESPIIDSVNDVGINQLSISIVQSESVEIRIRAVSEAGWPMAPVKGPWSSVIRIDFPNALTQNNLLSTINQNSSDLLQAQFNDILTRNGLMDMVNRRILDADKTFYFGAADIASGQYTSEQKNIPLDVMLASVVSRLNAIEKIGSQESLSISIVDFNNENISITNNSTINLFGGNYSDVVNIVDNTSWGTIITKKAYIKIKNYNQIPLEIKTLVPGVEFNSTTAPTYFNVPFKRYGVEESLIQTNKQILYFRNVDLTGQTNNEAFRLVVAKLQDNSTQPIANDIDQSADDGIKKIVYLDSSDNLVKICKLVSNYNQTFNGFTIENPLYTYNDKQKMVAEFERIRTYTKHIKSNQYQAAKNSLDKYGVGFVDNDKYAVGINTCGSFLYPIIPDINKITVNGNASTATLVIPKESEILIPIVFEYRMTDRLGNIDGSSNFDSTQPLEYSKKIGIDMLINNSIFSFDIQATAKLRSSVATLDSSSVSSVVALFTNEQKSTIA